MGHRLALALLALSLASGARAQDDLRALVVDSAMTNGCASSLEMLRMLVVDGMGRTDEELRAAIDAMVAGGEAELSPDGAEVRVLPPLCEAVAGVSLPMAMGWVEGVLLGDAECRMTVEALAAQTEEEGLPPEAFERALAEMRTAGAVVEEGEGLVHAACLETVPPPSPVEQVELFGIVGARGFVAIHLTSRGCRLPAEGRAAHVEEMEAGLMQAIGLSEPVPPEAVEAIRALIKGVLDNPGPAYEIDGTTGDLVLLHCQP